MNVAVLGLWHLGSVTAACLAVGRTLGAGLRSRSADTVAALAARPAAGRRAGLPELIASGLIAGALQFTTDLADAVRDADVVWVTFDTPVDDDDVADVAYVERQIEAAFPYLADGAVVLCSSQLPVGTVGSWSRRGARRPPGGRFRSRARRRTCGSARPSRCSRTPTA